MKPGYFITFEGGEGAGKSTQVALLDKMLCEKGYETVLTREPGGSTGAEQIRALIVTGSVSRWPPISELLMLYAARLDHVEKVIKPALNQGKWVLCDRFFDSTFAYQGYGHKLGLEIISSVHELSIGDFSPDLTLFLDIDAEEGLRRSTFRKAEKSGAIEDLEDRFERMDKNFHSRIRAGFIEIAQKNCKRSAIIDATGDKKTIFRNILRILESKLGFII